MIEIKAPNKIPETSQIKIFLAGSIEMGIAEEWQEKVAKQLENEDIIILNPRRDNWDNSWTQSKDNPKFREQVEWELDSLAKSDYIILYLDPKTKSPISLLELGLHAKSGKLLIVCPEGFWRKGNVDIVSEKYGFPQFDSLDSLLDHLIKLIRK
ncbi:MAG: hypothetical protein US50_C0006G0008 [Candidatus Nomurabacteria bacterium GW2011_GWB1_37_5]|uniref:Nucleoside 2-deoxyribosyltransferase n=1 Tax=Candidatus Nomurabacteria bacterium GW2011_GWB1_37_5 TaxID=1618742 RepID=A0A0G0HB38_9BACT|nr:MAG: hypothetical protein US50_C0006G0008 [Candidatus Nomurabacteria bacterium GW2011_GWB1_37_5]